MSTPDPGRRLQPALHELVTVLAAPVTVLSEASGEIRPKGALGAYAADLRVLSRAELTVDGRTPEAVSHSVFTAGDAEFVGMLRTLGDRMPDPTVWVRRRRTVRPDGLTERIELSNVTTTDLTVTVRLALETDLAPVEQVKLGEADDRAPVAFASAPDGVVAAADGVRVLIAADGTDPAAPCWEVTVPARGTAGVGWALTVDDPGAVVGPAADAGFRPPAVRAGDRRLDMVVHRSVQDLLGLAAATTDSPADTFLTAGSPWYLTLFGRDSIWAARMLLPLGTGPAAGTLRTLARRQGHVVDHDTAEQPGKILHEVRRAAFAMHDTVLPPVYFGTVDATPLWICLLRDAWRWGLPADEVEALLDATTAALEWLVTHGDADGDGFLEYVDEAGRGLANQGWKDSGDSVRFADGTIATGPVALAEVQGYAYEAALAGAELLEAFGRSGSERWRSWAAALRENFRATFWVTDELGRYPALALDGEKRAVDAPASNMGHLLGTGLLDRDEAAEVAARLAHPSMSSGFGLRTMATTAGGYSPLSYHCGSVWPHDTAIAVHGLLREGFPDQAAVLAEGLLAAGAAFDGRLPELFAGFDATELPTPVPYPASCRPQAWSAAAAVVMVQAFLGLEADVPAGTVTLRPSTTVGAFSVHGLRIAGQHWRVSVDARGVATAVPPDGLTLHVPV